MLFQYFWFRLLQAGFFSSFSFSSLSLFLYLLSFLIPFFSFTLVWFYFCCLNHTTVKTVETIHVLNFHQKMAFRLKGKHSYPVQKQTTDILSYVNRRHMPHTQRWHRQHEFQIPKDLLLSHQHSCYPYISGSIRFKMSRGNGWSHQLQQVMPQHATDTKSFRTNSLRTTWSKKWRFWLKGFLILISLEAIRVLRICLVLIFLGNCCEPQEKAEYWARLATLVGFF